jgi:hypothetical protein
MLDLDIDISVWIGLITLVGAAVHAFGIIRV